MLSAFDALSLSGTALYGVPSDTSSLINDRWLGDKGKPPYASPTTLPVPFRLLTLIADENETFEAPRSRALIMPGSILLIAS